MRLVELIGNTPLVELENIPTNSKVKILCKLEGQNPGGSVKDRAAYNMLRSALDRGEIKSGDKLVEATSGNTGIALAMVAKVLGLEMTLIMPDNSTKERVLSMKAYGARVILTPAAKTIEYSRTLAEEMNLLILIITLHIIRRLDLKSGMTPKGKSLISSALWGRQGQLWAYLNF
jgi:cysteine synthase B